MTDSLQSSALSRMDAGQWFTTLIRQNILVQANITVDRMSAQQKVELADEIYVQQPNVLAPILVLPRYRVDMPQPRAAADEPTKNAFKSLFIVTTKTLARRPRVIELALRLVSLPWLGFPPRQKFQPMSIHFFGAFLIVSLSHQELHVAVLAESLAAICLPSVLRALSS